VFLSYANADRDGALVLMHLLEQAGVRCWSPERDILPGRNWGESIEEAIRQSAVMIAILSLRATYSRNLYREAASAIDLEIPVIPLRSRDGQPLLDIHLELAMKSAAHSFLWDPNEPSTSAKAILAVLPKSVFGLARELPPSRPKSKGYAFLSYLKDDRPFANRLIEVFGRYGYGYWDYFESARDYHGALYKELEGRIENASVFICIVSEAWRESEWVAAEYMYARDAQIPVFVIQAAALRRPMPLILNLQTRIDLSADFERGAQILGEELKKEGL
jgi:hypothetical protein